MAATGPPDPGQVLAGLARTWSLFVLRGIAAVLFGLITLVWPSITISALVILFGLYAMVDGVGSIWSAIRHREDAYHRGFHVLEGIVALAVGILTLVLPNVTALALIWLIGIWALGTGIAEIVVAIRIRRRVRGEWVLALAGALSVLVGVIILVRPGAGALGIALVIGIYALMFGASLIGVGLRLRRLSRTLGPSAGDGRQPAG